MHKLLKQIRRNTVTGILLLIPSVTTAYVFIKLFLLVDSIIPNLFNTILPFLPKRWIPGIGIVMILVVSYFVGVAAKNYFGRLIIDTGNAVISKIPFINKIYLSIQQIIDTIVRQKRKNFFERVVLVEYPHKNIFCIGFVTSEESSGELTQKLGGDVVSVFVPTTPNPTSGFLFFIPKAEVIPLNISTEAAIKLVMSAGVVTQNNLAKTGNRYNIPSEIKNFNWLKMFRRKNANGECDEPPKPS